VVAAAEAAAAATAVGGSFGFIGCGIIEFPLPA